jgi:DNA-binding transcriptional ArsR family regulator
VDIKEKVLAVLRAERQPLNAGKITDLGGLERKEVDKAMAQLKKEGMIVSPRRCYWTAA